MKQLRTSRFWLLTTAALIFGSHMSASAQSSTVFQPGNYQVGAPTTVAAAPSLPNISADQIARDVTAEFNPRTGQTELIAATFDPFEDDPNLAGSLRLRSADGAVAINGQPLAGGALVEVDFYYNSPSDDPYGGRNYSDVSFVSGDLAPVVLRDTRILECSSRVDNVVYDHNVYYSPPAYYSPQVSNFGIYQPYRHYTGHSSFGFGFGSNYFGPGINFFNNSRSRRNFGTSRAFLPRTNLPNGGFRRGFVRQGRIITPVGPGTAVVGETNNGPVSTPNAQTNTLTPLAAAAARQRRDIRNRISGRRLTAEDFLPAATPAPNTQPVAATATSTTGISSAQTNTQSNSATSSAQQRAADIGLSRRAILRGRTGLPGSGRAIPKQSTSTPVVPKQTAPGRVIPKQTRTTPVISKQSSSTPKQSSSRRTTTPKRSSSSSSRSSSSSSRSSSPRSSSSSRRSSPRSSSSSRRSSSSSIRSRRLNFFPSSSHGGQSIVTSQSVDCAREDKLSVFIPNDRLDAARFDGLTLIALDAQGGETPIYIPPNYIQGYRLAATGQVQPQGLARLPQSQIPQSQLPFQQQQPFQGQRPLIEAASCPVGTNRQPDGTCLQTTLSGYPAR